MLDVGCWMFHFLGVLSIVLYKHSQKIVQTGGAMALVFFSSACITFIPASTVMVYSTTIRPSQASAHPPDYKPSIIRAVAQVAVRPLTTYVVITVSGIKNPLKNPLLP